jgi:hypothetical protein
VEKVMKWYDDIPWLGWHPDDTLFWHTLRDAAITLAIGLVSWIFINYLQEQGVLNTNYPFYWIIGATGGYFFSCGFEFSERPPPRFFGIGDFAVSILGTQIVLNVALILSGWFDWTIFGAVLGCQVLMYLIVIGGLYVANKLLKRDIIRP